MRTKLICLFLFFNYYSSSQVQLQTGAAQFSLPLYSYSDPVNRIGYSISLNYIDGNGVKVSEIASCVGTGWDLNAGGVISRVQHGEPDDQKQPLPYNVNYTSSDYINNYYPNGYLYSEFSPGDAIYNGASWIPLYAEHKDYRPPKTYIADREQDFFTFTFGGRQGQFVIGKNGVIKTLGDSKLKITKVGSDLFASNVRTTISEFQITDENGIKYVFKDLELSEVIKYDQTYYGNQNSNQYLIYLNGQNPCNNWFNCKQIVLGRGINEFVVSKWFLTEIINPLTNSKITFIYENYNVDLNGNILFDKTVIGSSVNYSLSLQKIKGQTKRLKTISSSPRERVEFNYYNYFRLDVPTDRALETIKVYYDDELQYGWKFSSGYSGLAGAIHPIDYTPPTTNDVEEPYYRLYLFSIQKVGKNSLFEPPYTFDYFFGSSDIDDVPARFSFYRDLWGYSNSTAAIWQGIIFEPGNNLDYILNGAVYDYQNVFNDPTKKQAYPLLAQSGILNSVQYPAKGKLSFEYEQNTALNSSNSLVYVGGVRVKKTVLFDGTDHAKDIQTEYFYVKENGSSSGWGYEPPIVSQTTNIRIHKCGDNKYAGMNLQGIVSNLPSVFIKSIATAKEFTLKAVAWNFFLYLAVDVIIRYVVDLFTPNYQDFTSTYYPGYALNENNLLPLQYSRVEVKNSIAGNDNGKTIYEFTSNTDFNYLAPTFTFPYAQKQRVASWAYGLPKKITVKDKFDVKKKEIINTYDYTVYTIGNDISFLSKTWAPNYREYDCWYNNGLLGSQGTLNITAETYFPNSGRTELIETKEYTYNPSGGYALKTTQYTYSPQNFLVNQITTTNSKGEKIKSVNKYPEDYLTTSGTFLQTMIDNNIISSPVGSFTYITKPGNIDYLLTGNVTEYSVTQNGDIKPINIWEYESNNPIASNILQISNSIWNPNANSNYFRVSQSISYSSDGQLVQIAADNGKSSSFIDYNGRLTTAVVSNASLTEAGYTSFEGENKGNWNYDEQYIKTDFSPTGNRHYLLSPNACLGYLNGLISTKKYIVSFWCKGGVPSLTKSTGSYPNFFYGSAGTLIKSYANSATGWTYYEYEISNAGNLTLDNGCLRVLAGYNYPSILIDELRLYPIGASISSVTYDPLFGKTSECDVNGRITYYEYDELGRLKVSRDENRNVLKAYEYNYKQ